VSASDVIARLRELHAEHLKAAGPFKTPRNRRPLDHLRLADLDRDFVAAASVALPALLECAEALEKVLAACDQGRMVERGAGGMTIAAQIRRSVINGVPAMPIEEARAALQALAGGSGE